MYGGVAEAKLKADDEIITVELGGGGFPEAGQENKGIVARRKIASIRRAGVFCRRTRAQAVKVTRRVAEDKVGGDEADGFWELDLNKWKLLLACDRYVVKGR